MTDRSLRFFATRAEAQALLDDWRRSGALIIVGPSAAEPAQRFDGTLKPETRSAFIGYDDLSDGDAAEVVKNPGAHAWVGFRLPYGEPDTLYMAGLDIRTKWLHHDNPAGVAVFDRVAKLVRQRLRRPTEVWSITSGARQVDRNAAYTEGALNVFAQGTPWMQEGVANIRFGPAPAAPRTPG